MAILVRFLLLLCFFTVATSRQASSSGTSACDNIHNLPEECTCVEQPHYHVVIECLKPFDGYYFNDTVGIKVDIDPCNSAGSTLDLDFVDIDRGIEYTITGVRAGEEENVPIPGMAILVPGIGNVGLDAAILIEGNPDMLKLQVGLNACAAIHKHEICASSIPGLSTVLPYWILKGTYSFGSMCENRLTHEELVALG